MDDAQLWHFLDLLIGYKSIGATQTEEISVAVFPEMRSFLVGLIGGDVPKYASDAINNKARGLALAQVLDDACCRLRAMHAPPSDDGLPF